MIKVYITTVSEIDFDGARERLSEYRRNKARGKNGNVSLAAGLLLDYALCEYGLCERDMEYAEGEHGKPFFKNHLNIKFSLSHSGEYAVCAVSDKEVGVDAEQYGDTKNILEIAERYFTGREYKHIKNGDAKTTFFGLWTRKESLLKAIGTGIAGGLKTYEVLEDEITVGETEFYFSEIGGYANVSITVCAEEKATDVTFVTKEDFIKKCRD